MSTRKKGFSGDEPIDRPDLWVCHRCGQPTGRPPLLTSEEVARIFTVRIEAVRIWVRQGRLSAYMVGPFLRFSPEAVAEFRERCLKKVDAHQAWLTTRSGRLILPSERYRVSVVRVENRQWPFAFRVVDRTTGDVKQAVLRDVPRRHGAEAKEKAVAYQRQLNGLPPLPRADESEHPLYRVRKGRRSERPGQPWTLRWEDPPKTGRTRQETIGNLSEEQAEQYRRRKEAHLNGVTWEGSSSTVLWADFKALYLKSAVHHLSAPTFRGRRQTLSRFEKICRPRLLADVDRFRASQYREERSTAVAPATVASDFRELRAAWSWAINQGLCKANPFHQGQPSQELLTRRPLNRSQPAAKQPRRRFAWLAEAMLLVLDQPDLSDAEVARQVHKYPGALSRSKAYQRAAAAARGQKEDVPRGYRDPKTGELDAYSGPPQRARRPRPRREDH